MELFDAIMSERWIALAVFVAILTMHILMINKMSMGQCRNEEGEASADISTKEEKILAGYKKALENAEDLLMSTVSYLSEIMEKLEKIDSM